MRSLIVAAALTFSSFALADKPITITVLHTNDLHAHIAPVNIAKLSYGGYARQASLIKKYRAMDPNTVLLSAGDTFQGTLYFNVYEGLADAALLNIMGYDAACVGNHEFDRGPATLAKFCKSVNFPVVCANLDFSKEPLLSRLVQPSTVLTVGGEKLGIVGAITPDLPTISSPGPNISMKDLTTSVQSAVDDLYTHGVKKILVLSHVGYREEQSLATRLHHVAAIVGGHSHTPLGTPSLPGWPKSEGPYPTVVKDADGRPVYVVQSWEWGKVFGRFKISFDSEGHVTKVFDAAPIVVDSSVPEDPVVKAAVTAFEKPLLDLQNKPIGSTDTPLARGGEGDGESLMADVIADAMLEATKKQGAVAAFVNAGGVRSGLEAGPITYGQAISVQPFTNTLVVLELTGSELKKALEEGCEHRGGFLEPSVGTSYRVDFTQPFDSRVSNIVVAGAALDPAKTYPITFLNFTANGGDSHDALKSCSGKRTDTGLIDIDALVDFIKAHTPLKVMPQGRIQTAAQKG